jgi:hypothetical protein
MSDDFICFLSVCLSVHFKIPCSVCSVRRWPFYAPNLLLIWCLYLTSVSNWAPVITCRLVGPRHGVDPLSQSVSFFSFLTFGFPGLISSEGRGFIAQANVSCSILTGLAVLRGVGTAVHIFREGWTTRIL